MIVCGARRQRRSYEETKDAEFLVTIVESRMVLSSRAAFILIEHFGRYQHEYIFFAKT